jgi:hypothetical protein
MPYQRKNNQAPNSPQLMPTEYNGDLSPLMIGVPPIDERSQNGNQLEGAYYL